jgi:hypothetical protein
MNLTVFRMLRGYVRRSAGLYAIAGLAQFLLTEFYWTKGFARVSVPAALLGVWGFATAIDARSLIWRSLPLTRQNLSAFRWWAIAGAPALWIALCDSIAWISQRTSPGLPSPSLQSLLQSILLGWAALGVIAALPLLFALINGRWPRRVAIALIAAYALWLAYGLPAYSASPAVALGCAVSGFVLTACSGIASVRGRLWRWPDSSNSGASLREHPTKQQAGSRFGVAALLLPLLSRTLAWSLAATGAVVLLYRFFPSAGAWLFWSYFLAISAAGFLLTHRVRAAIQILRILPMSAGQLAFRLQLYGALPGIGTLVLALLVNAIVLHLKLDLTQFAALGLIAIAAQALPISAARNARVGAALMKWISLFQRLWPPLYVGIAVLSYEELWAKFWWVKWPLTAAGLVLCLVGYYTLLEQVRAGVRPASNEDAFSAR